VCARWAGHSLHVRALITFIFCDSLLWECVELRLNSQCTPLWSRVLWDQFCAPEAVKLRNNHNCGARCNPQKCNPPSLMSVT